MLVLDEELVLDVVLPEAKPAAYDSSSLLLIVSLPPEILLKSSSAEVVLPVAESNCSASFIRLESDNESI